MSGIKGHPNQKRQSHSGSAEKFVSVVQTDPKNRAGLDVLPKAIYPVDVLDKTAEALDITVRISNPELRVVKLTGASASVRAGDLIRFTTGDNKGMEIPVEKVETDYIYLAGELLSSPSGADFKHMRHITLTIDDTGALTVSPGALEFVKDGVTQQVIKDTVTAANTVGLPVEIVAANGTEINITAGDINVQTSHTGTNPDSMRIGDGTEELQINAAGEATVRDADAIAQLTSIAAEDFATETTLSALNAKLNSLGQKLSAGSMPVVLSSEQEALIDELETLLTSLDGKDYATETTLAALLAEMQDKPDVIKPITPIDVSATGIVASSDTNGTEIIASTPSDMIKIQTIEDVGEYLGLYSGAAGALVLEAILPIAGGVVEVEIPAGTRLSIKHLKNSAINTATFFAANLIG